MEHSQTSRGKGVGDDVSKLSSKEPLLQERKRVMGALFAIRLGDVSEAKVDGRD